jgi:hypothetical protein
MGEQERKYISLVVKSGTCAFLVPIAIGIGVAAWTNQIQPALLGYAASAFIFVIVGILLDE